MANLSADTGAIHTPRRNWNPPRFRLSAGWSVYLNGIREDYDQFAVELGQIGEYLSSKG